MRKAPSSSGYPPDATMKKAPAPAPAPAPAFALAPVAAAASGGAPTLYRCLAKVAVRAGPSVEADRVPGAVIKKRQEVQVSEVAGRVQHELVAYLFHELRNDATATVGVMDILVESVAKCHADSSSGHADSGVGGAAPVPVSFIWTAELRQLLHPNAVIPLKLDARRVQTEVISAVWSFFAVYMFCFVLIWLALLATNLDFVSAFSAVVATMNNLGPGLGEVAKHYGAVSEPGKLTLCLAMLMGRLEVFTLLVLLTPAFWRH